jgi:hypothetical protein
MKYLLPLEITSIQGDGFHVFTHLKMGRKKLRLLVDTGASRTVFDLNRILKRFPELELQEIDRLSTGLGAIAIPGKSAELKGLSLGELKLTHYQTMILDLSHVNKSYIDLELPQVDGVLGSDLLSRFKAVIDYKKSLITLSSKKR